MHVTFKKGNKIFQAIGVTIFLLNAFLLDCAFDATSPEKEKMNQLIQIFRNFYATNKYGDIQKIHIHNWHTCIPKEKKRKRKSRKSLHQLSKSCSQP